MKLLDKVKKRLEENYGIDFLSEFWTDDQIVLLEDIVDATEKEVNNINYTRSCKSDSEQLVCVVDYLGNFTKGKKYECKPDGKNHFEVYDDFGDWYSVHKKCFNKTELACIILI